MTKQRYFTLIMILGTLTTLAPFSIDMYLPGFPAIAAYMHTTVSAVSLSVSAFFIGLAAGQLLYGPLLDKFGRKKPLYFGLSVYIIASIGCALAKSLDMLIIMRIIQALGSCAAMVAAMALVRDLFPVSENAKVFALLMLVIAVSPMLAPTIGGYVTAGVGWQWIFVILAGMAAIMLLMVIFVLPDGYKPDSSMSLKPGPIINGFLVVIKNPQFYTYALTGAFAFSGLFAYVSGSPLVFMEVYKVDSKVYGWIFAFLSIGLVGSGQINTLLLRKYSSIQIVRVAVPFQVLISLLLLTLSVTGLLHMYGMIALMFLLLGSLGITNPNTAALCMAPFSNNAGTASSLMGTLQMGIGALVSMSVGFFDSKSVTPLAIVLSSSALVAFAMLFISSSVNKKHFVGTGDGAVPVVGH